MNERILNKIPRATLSRLEDYVNLVHIGASTEYAIAKIITACSVLYDCGFLTMAERAEVSRYFRTLAKEGSAES